MATGTDGGAISKDGGTAGAGDAIIFERICKYKTRIFSDGNEIQSIRNKGFSAVSNSSDRVIFRGMYHSLDKIYDRFNQQWEDASEFSAKYNTTPSFPTPEDDAYKEEVKRYYYEAHGLYAQINSPPPGTGTNTTGRSILSSPSPQLNSFPHRSILPPIKIKPFGGQQSEFPSFKDAFESSVMGESGLSDAQRFQYLVASLEGPPANLIKHFAITNDNFPLAWNSLLKVYDSKRKLACTYLDRLLTFKPHTGKPSADSLQQYLTFVTDSVLSLERLKIPQFSEYLLCELALRCLDPITRECFEDKIAGTEFPKFNALNEFIQQRCQVLRMSQDMQSSASALNRNPIQSHRQPPKPQMPRNVSSSMGHRSQALFTQSNKSSEGPSCYVCRQSHAIRDCQEFRSLTPAQRVDKLKRFPGCSNCLHISHKNAQCPSKWSCRYCQKRHNSLLHLQSNIAPNQSSSPSPRFGPHPYHSSHSDNRSPAVPPEQARQASSSFAGTSTTSEGGVLLGTVKARILDSRGYEMEFKGVLDQGSMFSFVTSKCVNKLGKTIMPFKGLITGVDSAPLANIQGKTNITFVTRSVAPLTTEAVIVPTITPHLPQSKLESSMWKDYQSFDLSDSNFTTPSEISFLIGADLFPEVVIGPPVVVHKNGPRIMNTVFGNTVIGRYSCDVSPNNNILSLCTVAEPSFHLQKFWEIEEPTVTPSNNLSPAEQNCEAHFVETHCRSPEGRYMVSLPFTTPSPIIVPNISRALSRFYALENKLAKNDQLRVDYNKFISEYIELNHMSIATSEPSYLIPHHPIYQASSDGGLKLRVVFDASFRTPTGSLNDHLYSGPKLQADIGIIIMNFRRHKYALSCDIVKMFRQILVSPEHRKYQQIVWRFNPGDALDFYELNTVTYGLRSSPYQAQRVLKALVQDEGAKYPLASQALNESLYVDDIATGANSIPELIKLRNELVALLAHGEFELSKWKTNYPPLLGDHQMDSKTLLLCNDEHNISKILGMVWDSESDVLKYNIQPPKTGRTKREVLSVIAQLYDPLGFLSPSVFYAKCLLQNIWKSGIGWDVIIPSDINSAWEKFVECLPSLDQIQIPRHLVTTETTYSLICFSDASELGYCGVAYLLGTQGSSNAISILKAKTRLAPLKRITIPRLELCGAYLLSQIISSLESLMHHFRISSVYCFTDSKIVLAWLNTPVYRLNTFVGNRVQKILEKTEAHWWHHVKGSENPADVGSRGLLPSSLPDCAIWWSAPSWCLRPIAEWPISSSVTVEEIPELKPKTTLAMTTHVAKNDLVNSMERHSKFLRLVRTFAFVRRFVHNARLPKSHHHHRRLGPITADEFTEALHSCIKLVQSQHFPSVLTIEEKTPPQLQGLSPYVDGEGLIRVGGRLSKALLPADQKHQLLLPSRCHFTSLVVDHVHRTNHHAGPTACLAFLRQRYWIPSARNLVRLCYLKCTVCRRRSNSFVQPPMGDLPHCRVDGSRAFHACGVDLGGPFLCREGSRKNARIHKCYLVLYICMASRAVHLEMSTALSVEAFMDTFDRFIAIRGVPADMYSDCGTNFIGSANYIEEVRRWFSEATHQSSIIDHSAHLNVRWHFNPPSAPHFGGSWEAGIKSAKQLLYKIVGSQPFSQNELHTIFTKVGGILNSRPLQPLSTSPMDAEALTPGHFLIGQPINSLPEPDLTEVPENRLNRWQFVRSRIQHFWTRWKNEYLHLLQARNKWLKRTPNIRTGEVVLIRKANTSPTFWPLGRVEEVHPGADGIVRVVTLRTSRGILKRPSVDLIRLVIPEG